MSIPEGPYMWPASVLNALRRDAVEALENLLITDHETAWAELAAEPQDMSSMVAKGKVQYSEPMVSARVDELEAVKASY